MLLQRLKEYADTRMELPPQLYSDTAVRYIIELDTTGKPLGIIDTADPANPKTKRGQRYAMPQVSRSVGIAPLLLADNAEYTLALGRETSKPDRVAACHAAYRDILDRCAAATNEPDLRAIQQFYADGGATLLILPADFDRGTPMTFRVDGLFPTALAGVQAFWVAEHDPAAKGAQTMQCIVCGHERLVLERLQGKVKGVPGGQTSGTSIISANSTAFESYGLEASLVAPTCADCGERFTKAVNELLGNEQHRIIIGGAAFLFWTREDVPFDFGAALSKPEAPQIKALIDSVRTGKRVPEVDDTAFYATSLSGSGARVVVRDWIDTTVGDAKHSLARWFQLQALTDDHGQLANPLGIYALAGATVRDMKDLPTTTPRALLHAALTETPLPMALLYQAIRRSRAEQGVTRQRAALIKLVLLSHEPASKEATMVDLDQNHSDPGYHCGRLLAVLADIQEAAIGKAAIVDRFYGTASSAPASVFGRLLRGAQPHIAKLERDRRNVAVALQRRLEGVMSSLGSFPKILTLEQQGLFALGFYHQRAYDRAQMYANAARKQAAATATTDTTNTGELSSNDEAE
jgi:CRISPR-associated protein Csd1